MHHWLTTFEFIVDNTLMANTNDKTIATNRKAKHDFHIEDTYEVGLVLLGWEVKSARGKTIQLKDSHVHFKHGEAFLSSAHFSVPKTTCQYTNADPSRPRKILMHKRELDKLMVQVQQKGYTLIPLDLYWCNNRVKMTLALGKGKKLYDKRASLKEKEWKRSQDRAYKHEQK
jgi:SsrA-binding protein